MKSSIIFILIAFGTGISTLAGAPRLTSVDPKMASPGDALTASGTDLTEVQLLFLTLGSTDVKVQITAKSADKIEFKLPANVPHGQYRLMLQTGGKTPAQMVQPIICEVMSAAEIAERKAELEKEELTVDAAPLPAEETPPAK